MRSTQRTFILPNLWNQFEASLHVRLFSSEQNFFLKVCFSFFLSFCYFFLHFATQTKVAHIYQRIVSLLACSTHFISKKKKNWSKWKIIAVQKNEMSEWVASTSDILENLRTKTEWVAPLVNIRNVSNVLEMTMLMYLITLTVK
jgi:hypothetical protein